jgi:hypothetical protein
MSPRTKIVIGLCFVGLAGCGGAVDSDLFSNPADASGTDTSSGVDASRPDGNVDPPDANVIDATPIVDASPDVISVIDAGPVDPGTLCMTSPNSSYCKNESELCCIKQSGSACIASNTANTCTSTRMFCDNGDSCKNGEICCGSISFNGQTNAYTEIKCSSSCNVSSAQIPGQRRFCNPNAKTDECIVHGLACKQSGILPGYFICQ